MIYLVLCIVIDAVEDGGARGRGASTTCRTRRRLAEHTDAVEVIGPLVTIECRVGPLREENFGLHDHDHRALKQFRLLPLHSAHQVRAAELRARYGIRVPDELHLAAAQLHGYDQLWTTNDRQSSAAKGRAVAVTESAI